MNTSVSVGEWAMFTCSIHCSPRELVTWFVNGSPVLSAESYGFKFRTDPQHSHCNDTNSEGFSSTLSLKVDHPIQYPKVNIYCAVVSLMCDLVSSPNCTSTVCHSQLAHLEGNGNIDGAHGNAWLWWFN